MTSSCHVCFGEISSRPLPIQCNFGHKWLYSASPNCSNSMTPAKFINNFKETFFNAIYRIVAWALAVKFLPCRWMHQNRINEKSTQAWRRQAKCHYPSQYWPRSSSPYVASVGRNDISTKNGWIVILTTFSSLAAQQFFKMTTSGAASDDNVVKIITFHAVSVWRHIRMINPLLFVLWLILPNQEEGKDCWDKFMAYIYDVHPRCNVQHVVVYHLTHWGRDKMNDISQTTFSHAFSWMKMYEFRLRFHWNLFLRVKLTVLQHWFR